MLKTKINLLTSCSQLATLGSVRDAMPKKVEVYVSENGTEPFSEWLNDLDDPRAKVLLDKTISKMRLGNLGDHKSVGEGVQEVRITYGPGYRVYFGEFGKTLVVLLCGGTKKRQDLDIKQAKLLLKDWKARSLNET